MSSTVCPSTRTRGVVDSRLELEIQIRSVDFVCDMTRLQARGWPGENKRNQALWVHLLHCTKYKQYWSARHEAPSNRDIQPCGRTAARAVRRSYAGVCWGWDKLIKGKTSAQCDGQRRHCMTDRPESWVRFDSSKPSRSSSYAKDLWSDIETAPLAITPGTQVHESETRREASQIRHGGRFLVVVIDV